MNPLFAAVRNIGTGIQDTIGGYKAQHAIKNRLAPLHEQAYESSNLWKEGQKTGAMGTTSSRFGEVGQNNNMEWDEDFTSTEGIYNNQGDYAVHNLKEHMGSEGGFNAQAGNPMVANSSFKTAYPRMGISHTENMVNEGRDGWSEVYETGQERAELRDPKALPFGLSKYLGYIPQGAYTKK